MGFEKLKKLNFCFDKNGKLKCTTSFVHNQGGNRFVYIAVINYALPCCSVTLHLSGLTAFSVKLMLSGFSLKLHIRFSMIPLKTRKHINYFFI